MAHKSSIWLFTSTVVIVLMVGMAGVALAQEPQTQQPDQSTFDAKIEAELITKFSAGPADFIVGFIEKPDLSLAYQMSWAEHGE